MKENQLAGVGNTTQIPEHGLRVLVAAFNRRAGEADERRLGQRIAHVFGEFSQVSELKRWLLAALL